MLSKFFDAKNASEFGNFKLNFLKLHFFSSGVSIFVMAHSFEDK
jgi:hypothetical protein